MKHVIAILMLALVAGCASSPQYPLSEEVHKESVHDSVRQLRPDGIWLPVKVVFSVDTDGEITGISAHGEYAKDRVRAIQYIEELGPFAPHTSDGPILYGIEFEPAMTTTDL